MRMLFAETLKKIRSEKGLTQQELANRMFVTRSTIARWETGTRKPDATMLSRLSQCLDINIETLLSFMSQVEESPNVILVEDTKIVLNGALPVLEAVMPGATVIGFMRPSEAIAYARTNRVSLAFLDIELGKSSGLDLCRKLLEINHRTNVVFLTAYSEYSLDAWSTGASGFMLKPITQEGVRMQLKNLRYPF